jgi:hemerythrin-like domain-containing protein
MMLAAIFQGITNIIERRREFRRDLNSEPEPPASRLVRDDAPPALNRAASICEHLRAEHRRLERLSYRARMALADSSVELDPNAPAELEKLHIAAAVHFAREEMVLFPQVRTSLADILPEMEKEHNAIVALDQQVQDLLRLPPETRGEDWLKELCALGNELLNAIQGHIQREEFRLLRPAEQTLPPEDQQRLAAEMNALPSGT